MVERLTEEMHSGGGAWPGVDIRADEHRVNVERLSRPDSATLQLVVGTGDGIAESFGRAEVVV